MLSDFIDNKPQACRDLGWDTESFLSLFIEVSGTFVHPEDDQSVAVAVDIVSAAIIDSEGALSPMSPREDVREAVRLKLAARKAARDWPGFDEADEGNMGFDKDK